MTSRWLTRRQYRRLIDSMVADRDLLKEKLASLQARHDILLNVVKTEREAPHDERLGDLPEVIMRATASPEEYRAARISEIFSQLQSVRKQVNRMEEAMPDPEQASLLLQGAEAVLERVEGLERFRGEHTRRIDELELNRVHVDDYALVEAHVEEIRKEIPKLKRQATDARSSRSYHAKRVDDLAGDINRLSRVEDLFLCWARAEPQAWNKLVEEALSRVEAEPQAESPDSPPLPPSDPDQQDPSPQN